MKRFDKKRSPRDFDFYADTYRMEAGRWLGMKDEKRMEALVDTARRAPYRIKSSLKNAKHAAFALLLESTWAAGFGDRRCVADVKGLFEIEARRCSLLHTVQRNLLPYLAVALFGHLDDELEALILDLLLTLHTPPDWLRGDARRAELSLTREALCMAHMLHRLERVGPPYVVHSAVSYLSFFPNRTGDQVDTRWGSSGQCVRCRASLLTADLPLYVRDGQPFTEGPVYRFCRP